MFSPEKNSAIILVGEGEYHETLNITRRAPLTLLVMFLFFSSARQILNRDERFKGQLNQNATRPSMNASQSNLVQIWNNSFTQTGMDDAQSAVLIVAPSFDASLIGSGPTGAPLQPLLGSSDFKAYNIDFQNRAVRSFDGPPLVQN